MNYWLMKSEPDAFGLDDLERAGTEPWDGIRNYQARNFMREMAVGDRVLFYHSNCKPPGVAGTATIASEIRVDPTQFDEQAKYFDPRSKPEKPRWELVDLAFEQRFEHFVSLDELKQQEKLSEMLILRKGNRLSITPITEEEFEFVLKLGKQS